MRVLVLLSRRQGGRDAAGEDYVQTFRSTFADKVVGNLVGDPGFCSACAGDCTGCRRAYDRKFGDSIAGIIEMPAVLPYLLERPDRYVPDDVPAHDILLAVNVHEQILLACLRRAKRWNTRGVVAPIEAGEWISPAARAEGARIAAETDVQADFPKPFCAFDPPAGTVLAEFRRRFHVGKPHVELTVEHRRITRAYVHVSAACGATYYVARHLAGKSLDDDLKYDVVAKRLHCYPCTSSMAWDDEIGDTIMHVAGQAHYEILADLVAPEARPPDEPEMVLSPVGVMVRRPPAAAEGLRNIERAKESILEALATTGAVSLAELRANRRLPSAAVYSALLILKRQGRIRAVGGRITKA